MEEIKKFTCFFIILFVFSTNLVIGQTNTNLKNKFEYNIMDYMKVEEENSNDKIDSFRVYIVYLYDISKEPLTFNYTISYMLNMNDYIRYAREICCYREIKGHKVLLKMDQRNQEAAKSIGFQVFLETNPLINVVKRLHPPIPFAGFTYEPMQYVGSYNRNGLSGEFVEFGEKVEEPYRLF